MLKSSTKITKKQLIEILIVCVLMGIGLLIYDYYDTQINFDGTVTRNSAGAGNTSEKFELGFLDNKSEITVDVSEKSLSEKEVVEYFDRAIEEIDSTYLGQNKNANKVMYDLNLKSSYCDGLILAYWKFDKYGLISTEGKLNKSEIPDDGEVVNLVAELSYGEDSQLYSFNVVVMPLSTDTLEGKLSAIEKELVKIDEETKAADKYVLPKEVNEIPLSWKRKMNFRGLQVIILGIATVIGISIGTKRDKRQQEKDLIAEKEQDYPMIVSELSILLGAGMSFRKALEKIVSKYVQKKKTGVIKPGYEDMLCTYRKMLDGMGEIAALEDLGQKSESREYRKLAMLLVQNLKKGSKDLISSLEKEENYAYEMRKQRAIRAGEEASTKLLIPMAGMLFIVILILIVPAILQIKI